MLLVMMMMIFRRCPHHFDGHVVRSSAAKVETLTLGSQDQGSFILGSNKRLRN